MENKYIKFRSNAPSPRSRSLSPLDEDEKSLSPTKKRGTRGHYWFTNIRGEKERHIFPKLISKINNDHPNLIQTPVNIFQRIKHGIEDMFFFVRGINDTFLNIDKNDIILLDDGHAVFNEINVPINKQCIMLGASYSMFSDDNENNTNVFTKRFIIYGSEIIGVIKQSDGQIYTNWKKIIDLYKTTQIEGGVIKQKKFIIFQKDGKKYKRSIYIKNRGDPYIKFNGSKIMLKKVIPHQI